MVQLLMIEKPQTRSTCVEKLEEECACITLTFVECGFFHGDEHTKMLWDNFITFITFE